MAACLVDGDLGKYLEAKAEEKGLKVLGWWASGERHITNNVRPITKVEDMQGIRMRTPPNPIYLETFRLMGSNPQAIDASEVYQALQQGVVDGQENPYNNTSQRKFYEVQKYLSNSAHFFGYSWFLMNKAKYDALSDKERRTLSEAVKKITPEQWALARKTNADARDYMVSKGMEYTEIPAEEFVRFQEKTKPLYDSVRKQIGDEGMDKLMAAIASCR